MPRVLLRSGPALALVLLVLTVYSREMFNGFIWDDPQYVVDNPDLKDAGGLLSIWTDPLSLPQWYPMVHTSFWIEARLWGTHNAAGYHFDNVLLHALAVMLLWLVLQKLRSPWPWLTAAIFAIHPITVESVAWITERKNVLSLVFYLLSLLAYLKVDRLDAPRPVLQSVRRWYAASLLLFAMALLSKTVTCSLPAAILLLIWWKRGKITWRDITPLLPMFALGLVLAVVTSRLEATQVGARGPDFAWSLLDRCQIAGHAIVFYASKLLWPHPLMFMYSRWDLHADVGRQLIYPAVVATAFFGLIIFWRIDRRNDGDVDSKAKAHVGVRGRGPLAAGLFFVGTLVPALGFINVYPMRYSFVADHFQYLAAIGFIAFAVGMLSLVVPPRPVVRALTAAVILCPLIWVNWQQQAIYKNARVLWKNTVEQNPSCWMGFVNYAAALRADHQPQLAMQCSLRALQLAPNEPDTQYDVGVALAAQSQWDAARLKFEKAVQLDDQCAPAWAYLARMLWEHGNGAEDEVRAEADAERALKIMPNLSSALYVRGRYAEELHRYDLAIDQLHKVVALNDDDQYAHEHLGDCLLAVNRPGEAAGEYLIVLKKSPNNVSVLCNMGTANLQARRFSDAAEWFQRALAIKPDFGPAQAGMTRARMELR